MFAKFKGLIGSKFLFLNNIGNFKTAEIFAKIVLDLFAQITDYQNQLVYFRWQNTDDMFKKRLAVNFEHRFGGFKRQWTHSYALACSQNYTFHCFIHLTNSACESIKLHALTRKS